MGNNSTLDSGLLCLFFVLRVRLLLHFPCTDDDQKTITHIQFLYFLQEKSEGQACPFRDTSLGTARTILNIKTGLLLILPYKSSFYEPDPISRS